MSDTFPKGLRGLRWACGATRSWLLLNWYRALYPGLRVGRGVQLGRGVHISVVRGAMLSIGDNVNIERDCQLITEGVLSIDANGFVGTGTIIAAAERITIGRDALIAAYSTIRDQDHRRDAGSLPYNRQGLVTDPIVIGDNVWIGTKATILRGVRIGDNAVVGAQAVVTSNVEQDTVVAGIPAKVITRPARQLP